MQAPIYDDDEQPPVRDHQEELSFTLWMIMGGVLVLLYVLALVLLRSA